MKPEHDTPEPGLIPRSADDKRTVYTTKDVADRLAVSLRTVQGWVNNGDLPAFKWGKVIRIAPDALDAFIMAGCRTDKKTAPTGGFPTPTRRANELDALLARPSTRTPRRKNKRSALPRTPPAKNPVEA